MYRENHTFWDFERVRGGLLTQVVLYLNVTKGIYFRSFKSTDSEWKVAAFEAEDM